MHSVPSFLDLQSSINFPGSGREIELFIVNGWGEKFLSFISNAVRSEWMAIYYGHGFIEKGSQQSIVQSSARSSARKK